VVAAGCGGSDGGSGQNGDGGGGKTGDGGSTTTKIESAVIAAQSSARTRDLMQQLGRSISFLGKDDATIPSIARQSTNVGGIGNMALRPLPSPLVRSFSDTPALRVMRGTPVPTFLSVEEQFDETAEDMSKWIKDRILAESNIESKTDTEITYLLRADPTCKDTSPSSGSQGPDGGAPAGDGGASSGIDQQCAEDLTKLQVRIVVRADGDGARFQVLLGPEKYEMSVIIIHSDLLAWEINLAKAKMATDYANNVLGEGEQVFPVAKLVGAIKVAIRKNAEKNVTVSFGVTEAIEVEAKDVNFKTGRSDPLIALTADGVGETGSLVLAVSQTDVKTMWDPKNLNQKNMDLHVSIGGLSGETKVKESTKELTFNKLGIGKSFVAVRDTHILDLTFNPDDGGQFDLKAKLVNDAPQFEVTPKFDLSLKFNLAAVQNELNNPPKFLLDDTYSIRFVPTASSAPAVLEIIKETPTKKGGLKVAAGSLTLSASSNPAATVTVPAGMCLVGVDEPPMDAHKLLGGLASGTCP
jgi:hypothetical protein